MAAAMPARGPTACTTGALAPPASSTSTSRPSRHRSTGFNRSPTRPGACTSCSTAGSTRGTTCGPSCEWPERRPTRSWSCRRSCGGVMPRSAAWSATSPSPSGTSATASCCAPATSSANGRSTTCATARELRFASDPQALLADTDVPRRPNLGMVAEHLLRRAAEHVRDRVRGAAAAPRRTSSSHRPRACAPSATGPGSHRSSRGRRAERVSARLRDAIDRRRAGPAPRARPRRRGAERGPRLLARLQTRRRTSGPRPTVRRWCPSRWCSRGSRRTSRSCSPWSPPGAGLRSTEISPSPAGAAHYDAQARLHLDLPGPRTSRCTSSSSRPLGAPAPGCS